MKRITLPLAVSLLLLLLYGAAELFKPDLIGPELSRYVIAALLIGLSIAAVRAAGFVLFDVIFQKRKGREAPELLRVLLSIVLYSICFLLIYRQVLNREGTGFGIVATSTVASLIIGLALQDTLGNFFAGLAIHVEQPFHILDAIRIGEVLGRVEAVTWRTTTIRTNNNTTVVFPNSKVAREPLEVYRFNNLNRRVLRVPAPYSVAPQRVISLVQGMVAGIPNVASERTPRVRIGDFGDSTIIYEILYWVKDYMWIHDIDAGIRQQMWYIFRRNNIEIPFPTHHLLVEQHQPRATSAVDDHEKVIERVEMFEPLSHEEKKTVAASAVKSVYAPGELVLRRGDYGDSMFVIYRGRVEVRLPTDDGKPQHVAELEEGAFFGEMALLTGEPRTADIIAITEVETLEITKATLQELLRNNDDLAEALSRKIAERKAGLEEYAHMIPEEEHRAQTHAILRRIRHLFGLN